ncbi:MAG: winged helix-turn-helix domain-containing protein [Phycisphaerales bacterium]
MRAIEINAQEIASLDRVLHEPARLGIMSCLYVVEDADFVFLQSQTGMTGGNLSSHLKKLKDAGHLEITKTFHNERPRTTIALTKDGRASFEKYISTISSLLKALAV